MVSYTHTLPKLSEVDRASFSSQAKPLILIWENNERITLRGVLFDAVSREQCVYDQRILLPFSLGEHHPPLYSTCPECKCVYDFPSPS